MTTVAEVLAQVLVAEGIDTVFGLPGGENAEVLDAIRREGLDFVLVRNENSAVFMADTTARLTGKPGVALTTLGPGAANVVSGLANAYLDRAPVLLITAQSDGRLLDRHTHQVLDLQALFKPITKMTRELTDSKTREIVEESLRLTTAGRPGPVHLGISSFMAAQEAIGEARESAIGADPAVLNKRDIGPAPALLAQAKRPVILVGLGLEPERPYAALRQLAEAGDMPLIVPPKAKGALAADHPLFVGTIGLTVTDPAYEIINESDCITAVGFDVVELVKVWDFEQPLIWIAPWENKDPRLPHVKAAFVGGMGPILTQLARVEFKGQGKWGKFRVAKFREQQADMILPAPSAGNRRPTLR